MKFLLSYEMKQYEFRLRLKDRVKIVFELYRISGNNIDTKLQMLTNITFIRALIKNYQAKLKQLIVVD
jgi:hypothetical protein